MSKAINGEGSVKQRKSGKLAGKWRVQWSYEDPSSFEVIYIDKSFKSQKLANDFLSARKAEVRMGQVVQEVNDRKALKLDTWFDELAGTKANKYEGRWYQEGLNAKTIAYRVGRFNKYVRKSVIGTSPIKSLSLDRVRCFFHELEALGVGQPTIQKIKVDLVKVVNDAVDTYEKLPNIRNPFAKVKVSAAVLREAVTLSPLQAKAAIARQTTLRDRAMLGLFLMGGLRLAEQMAITKEQIDFTKGIILIDRAVQLGRTGAQSVGSPKSGKTRMVVMCPSLASLLQPLMNEPGNYLFPCATEDKPRMKTLVYATWRKIKKNGKLPAQTVTRDCRLSHNNWIEKLMPTVSMSTRLEHMGHSTSRSDGLNKGITVNLRNYTRFLDEAQDILRQELERVIGLGEIEFQPAALDEDCDLAS